MRPIIEIDSGREHSNAKLSHVIDVNSRQQAALASAPGGKIAPSVSALRIEGVYGLPKYHLKSLGAVSQGCCTLR